MDSDCVSAFVAYIPSGAKFDIIDRAVRDCAPPERVLDFKHLAQKSYPARYSKQRDEKIHCEQHAPAYDQSAPATEIVPATIKLVCKNDGAVCSDRPHQERASSLPRPHHPRQAGCGLSRVGAR